MTSEQFWTLVQRAGRQALAHSSSETSELPIGGGINFPPFCIICSRIEREVTPLQVSKDGKEYEIYMCDECKKELTEKHGGDFKSFMDSKAEEARSKAFEKITARYGNDPKVLTFIANQMGMLRSPGVVRDLVRWSHFVHRLRGSRSKSPTVEELIKLIKKQYPHLFKLLDSTLRLYSFIDPMWPFMVEWILEIMRTLKLDSFGIFDKPRKAKTKEESTLKMGEYIPESLELEILIHFSQYTSREMLTDEGEARDFLRKSIKNKTIDLKRREFFLSRDHTEKGEARNKKVFSFDKMGGAKRRMIVESELIKKDPEGNEESPFDSLNAPRSMGDIEKLIDIERAISSLDGPLDRDIFIKSFVEGKPVRQIAEEIPLGKSAISKRINRMKKVAEKFQIDPSDL